MSIPVENDGPDGGKKAKKRRKQIDSDKVYKKFTSSKFFCNQNNICFVDKMSVL